MNKIRVITGYYGVGKSEFAVNLALYNSVERHKTTLLDLDVINPYFRSREAKKILENNNINLISSSIDNETLDLPAISGEVRSALRNRNEEAVIVDLGGDISGIKVLNSFSDSFKQEDIELYYVINVNRITTDSLEDILKHISDIEIELGIKINYIVNNTHLLKNTKEIDIENGNKIALEIANLNNINDDKILNVFDKNIVNENDLKNNKGIKGIFFPIEMKLRTNWMI